MTTTGQTTMFDPETLLGWMLLTGLGFAGVLAAVWILTLVFRAVERLFYRDPP